MNPRTYRFALLLSMILILCLGLPAGKSLSEDSNPETEQWAGDFSDGWAQFEILVRDSKYEAASSLLERMLNKAIIEKDSDNWTLCLARYTLLRQRLHGYETAVRFLKEQPWPEDRKSISALNLFYAESLDTYAQRYSWQINRRERTVSLETVDLKGWTREQIYAEANRAFESVWEDRGSLGEYPKTEWEEFIIPNSYPEGIRPTLRDSVSYLWAEMLTNTRGWRPDQLNEVYKLNLERLAGSSPETVSLTDPDVHPLKKISFILADLENWHIQENNREAALEARLERFRQLHRHFSRDADRKFIQKSLETYLKPLKDAPWWSEGMAQLAEFVRVLDEPDSLIRAHRFAREGKEAFPESAGGLHCLSIMESIEEPDYALSGMRNDAPGKRSILLTHKNIEKVYFRAYTIDLVQTIETSNDYNLFPNGRNLEEFIADRTPVQSWSVSLPETRDYKSHKTFIVPPMNETGTYLIVASARSGFPRNNNRLLGLYMTISNLVLVTRNTASNLDVMVLSGSNGEPVAGANVDLYRADYREGHSLIRIGQTDEQGIVRFPKAHPNLNLFLIARKGDQTVYSRPRTYYEQKEEDGSSDTLIYTDRSIYRPGQKILWKAVVYRKEPGAYEFHAIPSTTAVISLRDGNNQEVASKTVTTNSFGTASGEFVIPPGRSLGRWRLESSRGGRSPIRVEEYKRPTFEVKLLDPEKPLRLNQKAQLKGEAGYYFGLPVTSGTLQWRVRRFPVYTGWRWRFPFGPRPPASTSQIVAAGTESVEEDGTFSIDFLPEADKRLAGNRDITYRYNVSVDLTDEGGETRSTERAFQLGFVSVKATASHDTGYFRENEPVVLYVLRTSLDGIPKAGKGNWKIVSLKNPPETLPPSEQPVFVPEITEAERALETPGDHQRPRTNPGYNPEETLMQWESGPEQASGILEHNDKDAAKISLNGLPAGAYRLIYSTADDFGEEFELRQEFIVASPSMDLPLPAVLYSETSSLKVGDTARLFVHSGFENQHMILEFFRDGECVERKEMHSGKDSSLVEIPVTEEDRGGLAVSLTLVRDHQYIQLQNAFSVPWDNKQLNVEFSSFRDRLRPGSREKWSVKVSGPPGEDMTVPAAELLAYMYDRSLDAIAHYSMPTPLGIYPYLARLTPAQISLGPAGTLWLPSNGFFISPPAPAFLKDRIGTLIGTAGGVAGGSAGGVAGIAAGLALPEEADAEVYARESRTLLESSASVGEVKRSVSQEAPEQSDKYAEDIQPEIELRSNFSETAFWEPHLLTDKEGSVSFEFEVPDSVTSWNVWVHAVTRDLKSGSVHRKAETVKDLMVRPYLPRFLREGDSAEIKIVVNNASDRELQGRLNFDIVDPTTDESVLSEFGLSESDTNGKPFTVAAGGGTNLTFPIRTPSRVGEVAFKVTARSGNFSDGELRPVPVLPGRMHLMQSRFITLKDRDKRVMHFQDLELDSDKTRVDEQMVVTLDAQLFYSVLSALPYLVNYPYECTEQTLNRFISTGILSSLYGRYPAIEKMAREFSSRETQFEQWDEADPNRKMMLEETPWLRTARGGQRDMSDLIRVLDSRVAEVQKESAISKLGQSQTSSGGFPWFPGGPPSPYMTLYILNGFSRALEFGVDVPRGMVQEGWKYMHRHYLDDIVRDMVEKDCCLQFVTYINYVLSNYPEDWYRNTFTPEERRAMLDFSFRHWRDQSPLLKGYLALTLKRMDRNADAVLVWESVMDAAKSAPDQGTFWAPEDQAWLWYNDTIETHAFAVRAEMELIPDDPKLDGLVQWLFLNKKMNHWKSTRATAEVIYSLAHYLKETGQLGIREDATVTIGNQTTSFVFEPDKYTGEKNRIVIPGEKIDPETTSEITVEKTGRGIMFASAAWHFSTEKLPEEERGDYLQLSRSYFKRVLEGKEYTLLPLREGADLKPGDEVEVRLSLRSKHPMEYVHLRDPRGAGFEPASNLSRHKWDLGISWYEEIRDSGTNFFFERLPQGEYTFKYRIRAATAGTFKVAPATAQPMYAPEFAAYSTGAQLEIR